MPTYDIRAGIRSRNHQVPAGSVVKVTPAAGASVLVEYATADDNAVANNVATWQQWPSGTVGGVTSDYANDPMWIRVTAMGGAAVLSIESNPSQIAQDVFRRDWASSVLNVGLPTISSDGKAAYVGQVLTAVAPNGLLPSGYQWYRDTGSGPQAISGATAATYTRTSSDVPVVGGTNITISWVLTSTQRMSTPMTAYPPTLAAGVYSRFMASELRSNENYVLGNTADATGKTTYYKFEFDAPFDSATPIILSKVITGTPATYKVQFAVTDEIKIDTANNTYLPIRAGVVSNVKGVNGWQDATFGGNLTTTIGLAQPADSSTPANTAISLKGDALPLNSIARADGKPGGILLMKVTVLNGAYTTESNGNDPWDPAAGQPFYRVRSLSGTITGDGCATLSIIPTSNYSGYGIMASAQVHTNVRAELLMYCGDSRDATAFSSYLFAGQNVLAWTPLSTSSRPLAIYNVAGSGHSQLSFSQVALDRIVNGGLRPTVIFYPGFSQNGFDTAANYKTRLNAFIANVRAVSGMANVKFVLSTDYYVSGYAGTQSETERQLCITYAKSLANGSTVFVFDSDAIMTDYSNPSAPTNVAAYMSGGDSIHAGPPGIAAMANGVSGKPGLQSVFQQVLALA